MERHLNLNGRDTSLIWTYSQVGRKCCFHNHALRYTPSVRVVLPAHGAGDDCKRVTRVSQFTTETRKRTQDRKARKVASLYTRLYFPRGFRRRKWPSCAAICGVRDTAYFRRCASSSLGLFLRAYVASWLAAFRAFRSHVLVFLFHRCELRTGLTTSNYFTIVAGAVRTRALQRERGAPSVPVVLWL